MTTERISAILRSVAERVEELIPSGRFYIVFYDQSTGDLSFPLVREKRHPFTIGEPPWSTRPVASESLLPDRVVLYAKSMLYEGNLKLLHERDEVHYWPDQVVPHSWLGVPIKGAGNHVLGALVLETWQTSYSFSSSDESMLGAIAHQMGTAVENAFLHDQQERSIENLRVLNHVGQQLTKGLVKEENEILELLYRSATKLQIDTQNMYIAFYDQDRTNPDTLDQIHGMLRFPLAFDEGKPTIIPNRPAENGLTEHVICTKQSFNPPNVDQAYRDLARDYIGKIPRSWLGVPMLSEGQVFGVIALRNNELERAYTEDNQGVLEILASQAAVALQNLQLYRARQEDLKRRLEVEKMYDMGKMAAEFAHKMNNIAGTIPVRVTMAREWLHDDDPRDQKVLKQLEQIELEGKRLLLAAEEIRAGTRIGEVTETVELVDVGALVDTAIEWAMRTRRNLADNIRTQHRQIGGPLPGMTIERNIFLDTLTSLIKNGLEAIEGEGDLMVETRSIPYNGVPGIEVKIKDTGRGIDPSELPRIFDLFYSTKGDKGMGFGLWRDRIYVKKLGGEIDVMSEVNHGSTFIIRFPAQ